MRLMSELIQFEIGISTNLYLPAIGTAGFDRVPVNEYNLDPCPPPNIIDKTSLLIIRPFILFSYTYLVELYKSMYSCADTFQE